MGLEISGERTGHYQGRFVFCYLAVFLFFSAVFARLLYLQVLKGQLFWGFSQEHTMKEIRIPASRGVIYDRNHLPIAENRPSFDLTVIPQHVEDIERVKASLQDIADVAPSLIDATWGAKWGKGRKKAPSYVPLVIASDIPYDQAVKIRAAKSLEYDPAEGIDLQAVDVVARPLRSYPQGPIAATTLGYIGEISEKDLARFQKEEPGRYVLGDMIGAAGLERTWEKILKGEDGYVQKIVDAVGRELQSDELSSLLTQRDARPGENLVLTIDSRLQRFAEQRFEGKSGALVALDPNNGDVLAMVSVPAYDPSALVSNVSHGYWAEIATSPKHLLLNRAIQGAYPPGSTYKVVMAVAALEEGVLKVDEKLYCPGGLKYGDHFFKCGGHHGAISILSALPASCDTFFYQMGLRLGVDRIAKYAHLFKLGMKTGIDVEGEKTGTIPTAEWKKRVFKEDWQTGENISIAIGQGYDALTPLQNALVIAQVASGRVLRPHLLKTIEDDEGRILKEAEPQSGEKLPVSEETLEVVRKGLLGVVEGPTGTARRVRSPYFKMAGKTGTAQVISEEGKARARGINTEDHAWFVAYAPPEDPRIAVATVVEHGGFGAVAAAPIVRDVIEKYLELEGVINKQSERKP